ncbi:hypothetical protein [Sporomusa sphaeroides]|uniref:Uncharacterized protein n=1 Tax=Sporomusa sphaeroides DSM 2875 TaxID=1337886 RepID=A0ABP2C756_9FIRM|nr:hypothetical protein [Sporomusa sphaeroides]OLS58562.1 hypothetical protein SPSPH_21100 [Sporomusa sphaeroides DSM 2875]CVK19702.1 hypothetical protein SSPH_02357 [Sporomusa sphaeroides DSM 2875]
MRPIQFAFELETSLSRQIETLHDTATTGTVPIPVLGLIKNSQTEFLKLLSALNTGESDSVRYPAVTETQLLGSDAVWQQATQNTTAANACLQELTALWSIYITIDKCVQFYQQAAVNSAQPQARLFFSSLSHVKKILRRRLDGIIQIYYNYYWGELGFAPFILGKD